MVKKEYLFIIPLLIPFGSEAFVMILTEADICLVSIMHGKRIVDFQYYELHEYADEYGTYESSPECQI